MTLHNKNVYYPYHEVVRIFASFRKHDQGIVSDLVVIKYSYAIFFSPIYVYPALEVPAGIYIKRLNTF
jgi:hypothetical protein